MLHQPIIVAVEFESFAVTAVEVRQPCYDALAPDEKTTVLFALARAAAAQVRP